LIVLDALAAVDWLIQRPAGRLIGQRIRSRNETIHAPHLFDLEVLQVLRRLARQAVISDQRVDIAVQDLLNLRIARYPHLIVLPRVWQLRDNLTSYDAAYVALAERLRAPLVTRDTGIAAASGHQAQVELF
jgi:predicted nucleic acid-binding protein